MNADRSTSHRVLEVVTSEPCPYIKGRESRTRLQLREDVTASDFRALLEQRYRRMGRTFFRPECGSCHACVPIRVPADQFRPTRAQRRVLRRNRDVEVSVGAPELTLQKLRLYARWSRSQHGREDADAGAYAASFVVSPVRTIELRYRIAGELAAVAITDEAPDLLSAVFTYFDPEHHRRSLGTFSILSQIELCRRSGRRWLYLGYYIRDARTMAYKARFQPAELLRGGRWVPFAPVDSWD